MSYFLENLFIWRRFDGRGHLFQANISEKLKKKIKKKHFTNLNLNFKDLILNYLQCL